MSVRVKICGVTTSEDAVAAERVGADAIGMILHARSRRLIDLEQGASVVAKLGPFIARVGVFVDPPAAFVEAAIGRLRLDAVQFHGHERRIAAERFRDRVRCIEAISFSGDLDVDDLATGPADAVLVDGAQPGSGVPFDWDAGETLARLPRWILAGGLTPATVAAAVRQLDPYGVDVASGVERSPGVKDHDAMARFVTAAKGAR
ncbi:phosphoribosylanthranilate isomerase [soil metagenome]|nr:phosphoribosylanthranilate isomerase [Trueperaceae bacterium]